LDAALGLLLLAAYIVGIVGLAAAITFGVIKIFPTERKPKGDATPEKPRTATNGETAAGSLFRRSKRGQS
jgi:hypothetical protein